MKKNVIRVTLIEDNPGDVGLIRTALGEESTYIFDIYVAESLKEMFDNPEFCDSIDVVLADLSLPDSTGLDTYHAIRQACPEKPIVIMTGLDDSELALQAVKEGAQDYIVKGAISGDMLGRTIRYAIERNRLLHELDEKSRQLQTAKEGLENEVAKRVQELLEERQRSLRHQETSEDIVNTISSGMFIYQFQEPDQLILVRGNPAAEQLTGLKMDEWVGKEFNEIWPQAKDDGVTDNFLNVIKTGETFNTEDLFYEDERITGAFSVKVFELPNRRLAVSFDNITDRKRAEHELQLSESRYRSVYETAPLAFVVWGLDTKITDWNQCAEQIFGWSRREVLGKSFFDIIIPDFVRGDVEAIISGIDEGEIQSHAINENLTKNGHVITCEWNNAILRNGNGKVIGAISLGLDITEKVKVEQALRERENRLQSILRSAPTGIGVVVNREIITVNEQVCEMTGYCQDDLIGKNARMLYPTQEDYEYVGSEKYQQIQERGTGTVETRWLKKTGEIVDVLMSSTPIDPDDFNVGVTFSALDITERKQAEAALQYRLKLESLNNEISTFLVNASGPEIDKAINIALERIARFVGANRSSLFLLSEDLQKITNTHEWCESPEDSQIDLLKEIPFSTFGYYSEQLLKFQGILISRLDDLPEEAVGERDWIKAHGFRPLCFIPLIRQERLYGTLGFYGEIDSEIKWFDEFTTMLEAVGNMLLNVLERKQAIHALHQLNEELEQRVIDRTAQLETKTQELEAFAYSVSHDLKAPLRGIDGYSRLLQSGFEDQLDEDGQFFVRNIRRATQNMHQLIDDLLAYSRLERREIDLREVELEGMVHTLLTEFTAQLQSENIQFDVDLPELTLLADADGLAQVMRNLIDNALKFSATNPAPRIEIGGRLEEFGCVIWVRDNGVGFDMRYHERIFEIFQRLNRPEDYPGTGIGLAIVAKSMKRMNGRVWAESKPGQGATFYLEFPRSEQ